MITAATSAKIAIEIAVTNQKTKSIRPACSLAPCGSQGIRSATAAAPAPKTAPIATSWTTDPLRTVRRDYSTVGASAEGSARLETPATSMVGPRAKRVVPGQTKEVRWDSE